MPPESHPRPTPADDASCIARFGVTRFPSAPPGRSRSSSQVRRIRSAGAVCVVGGTSEEQLDDASAIPVRMTSSRMICRGVLRGRRRHPIRREATTPSWSTARTRSSTCGSSSRPGTVGQLGEPFRSRSKYESTPTAPPSRASNRRLRAYRDRYHSWSGLDTVIGDSRGSSSRRRSSETGLREGRATSIERTWI